jgi:hypothetical protein
MRERWILVSFPALPPSDASDCSAETYLPCAGRKRVNRIKVLRLGQTSVLFLTHDAPKLKRHVALQILKKPICQMI